ncbi:MAG TPA: VWA domain-containing protein, partial [Anaerolineales bacterium]|nr:VWA domain-containing protein [Anaerolineales bacterium]
MSFAWPTLLLMLFCVPLLILFYLRIQQRRQKIAAQFGSLGVTRNTTGKAPGIRRHVPAMIFLTGITLLLISMARPQATVSVPRIEGTVILTFDVSGSMSADDLQPTRMEAAKLAALDFVDKQPPSVLIGVVAFSDGGISVQAPTENREETISTIERLVPRRGTSIGNGILVALNTIAVAAGDPPLLTTTSMSDGQAPTAAPSPQGWYTSAVVVLLTDGENNQSPDPIAATDLAADLGVRIYTVGIGSAAGATITVEGFTVHSQLNEPILQYIADTT